MKKLVLSLLVVASLVSCKKDIPVEFTFTPRVIESFGIEDIDGDFFGKKETLGNFILTTRAGDTIKIPHNIKSHRFDYNEKYTVFPDTNTYRENITIGVIDNSQPQNAPQLVVEKGHYYKGNFTVISKFYDIQSVDSSYIVAYDKFYLRNATLVEDISKLQIYGVLPTDLLPSIITGVNIYFEQ